MNIPSLPSPKHFTTLHAQRQNDAYVARRRDKLYWSQPVQWQRWHKPKFGTWYLPRVRVTKKISRIASETPRSGLTGNQKNEHERPGKSSRIKTWVFWILKCRFISKFNHCMFHSIERCYPQSSMVHYCRIPKTWNYIYPCDCFKTNMLLEKHLQVCRILTDEIYLQLNSRLLDGQPGQPPTRCCPAVYEVHWL